MLKHHVSCSPSKIPYIGFSPVRLGDKREKGVGPGYLTDIHRNDPEMWGDVGPIMEFLRSKRV